MAASKGVWVDAKTGKVVESQPEEGVQIVAPGVEPTPADLAAVEAAKVAASGEKSEAKTVTTKAAKAST